MAADSSVVRGRHSAGSAAVAELSAAERSLAKASTVAEVKDIYDLAEAYRVYATNAADQNRAAAFKLRAAAKGGELIDSDPDFGRGKPPKLGGLLPDLTPKAREHLSQRWQRVSDLARLGTLDAYLSCVADEDGGEVTMAGLFHYAKTGTLNSSESPEWYTPTRYLNAARDVLGRIDLDPASCAAANKAVNAKRYFTADDDALGKPWRGTVFLNPPYGKSAPKGNALFIPKLVAEYDAGHVTAAITLTSAHGTETDWFQFLWDYPVCFTDHRVPYWNEAGIGAPTFGSGFTYLGPEPERFAERFAEFGVIVRRWPA